MKKENVEKIYLIQVDSYYGDNSNPEYIIRYWWYNGSTFIDAYEIEDFPNLTLREFKEKFKNDLYQINTFWYFLPEGIKNITSLTIRKNEIIFNIESFLSKIEINPTTLNYLYKLLKPLKEMNYAIYVELLKFFIDYKSQLMDNLKYVNKTLNKYELTNDDKLYLKLKGDK